LNFENPPVFLLKEDCCLPSKPCEEIIQET